MALSELSQFLSYAFLIQCTVSIYVLYTYLPYNYHDFHYLGSQTTKKNPYKFILVNHFLLGFEYHLRGIPVEDSTRFLPG